MKANLALALLGAVFVTAPTFAQDSSAVPVFDDVFLEAKFEPDPRKGMVNAGGSIDISNTIEGCIGFVSKAPLVRLTFKPEKSAAAMPLFVHAYSKSDTTILVKAPDGNWYCNDDGFNPPGPMVVFSPAMEGDYLIWVGALTAEANPRAILAFSEVGADIAGFDAELSRSEGR